MNVLPHPALGTIITHSGGLPGFGSNMRWVASTGVGLVAMSNSTYAPMMPTTAAVLDALAEDGAVTNPPRPASPAVIAASQQLVAMLNGAEADAMFADNVDLDEPPAERRRSAGRLLADHGPFTLARVIAESTTSAIAIAHGADVELHIGFQLAPIGPVADPVVRRHCRHVTTASAAGSTGIRHGRDSVAMTERLSFAKAAPELYKQIAALDAHVAGHIDPVLYELVKLRASLINQCAFCIDMHSSDALAAGESAARLFGLGAWHETPLYTDRERAALALDRRRHAVRRARCTRRRLRRGPRTVRRTRTHVPRRRHRRDQHVEPPGHHVPEHAEERPHPQPGLTALLDCVAHDRP